MITLEEFKQLKEGDKILLTNDGYLLDEYCITSTLTNTVQFVMYREDDLIHLRSGFVVKQEHIAKVLEHGSSEQVNGADKIITTYIDDADFEAIDRTIELLKKLKHLKIYDTKGVKYEKV